MVYHIRQFYQTARKKGIRQALKDTADFLTTLPSKGYIQYLRLRFGETIIRDVQGSNMKLDVSTERLKSQLLLLGEIDSETTYRFRTLLERLKKQDSQGLYVFELGAHQGYYSLLAANILGNQCNVYAVEPSPKNVNRITENRDLNDYRQIKIINGAIGAEPDDLELLIDKKSYKNQILSKKNIEKKDTITVNVYTIDQLVKKYNIPEEAPLVIRMDVEYYEKQALAGMSSILQSDRPVFLFAEIHNSNQYSGFEILDILESHGFSIECIFSSHLSPDDIKKSNGKFTNIEVFAKRDSMEVT